jgi:hypothetical protein
MLPRSRLREGFGPEREALGWPGVAPLLHELGHMLDHFNPRTGGVRFKCDGLLPGMHPRDGAVFTPHARECFVRGRKLEWRRFSEASRGRRGLHETLPIGHPYVFQNQGEFCAGYLELFLRSPNAMAAMNPVLFEGYCALLGWDPRAAWPADFTYYLEQNALAYRTPSAYV